MSSFRRKILTLGATLLVMSALVSFYSYYKMNSIYGLIERNKVFEIPFSAALSELKANYESYRFEVNKIVSAPTSYSSYDVKSSIFKTQTETQLLKVKDMAEKYEAYSKELDEANKNFKNYVVSAAAIVDAFSSSADMDSQKESNIKSFSEIMKTSDAAFTNTLLQLDSDVSQNMVLGTSAVHKYFASAGFWVWTLFILMLISFAALFFYVSKVSNFVKAVNASLEDIRDGHYDADQIAENIPLVSEMEFFELADKVTRLSSLIYNDMTLNKDKIGNLEDEVVRLRTISSYTTAILNSIDSGIMVTDSLLKVSFVNYEFEKFWRVKKSSVIDTGVEDLPFIRLIEGWKDALKTGKTCYFKSKYKLPGKKSKEMDFCVMPLKDSNGKETIGTITLTRPSVSLSH